MCVVSSHLNMSLKSSHALYFSLVITFTICNGNSENRGTGM